MAADATAEMRSIAEGAYATAEVATASSGRWPGWIRSCGMVNGAAYAGGAVLAACSDIAIASGRALVGVSEALVGIADQLSTTWLEASIGLARIQLKRLTRELVGRAIRTAPGARAAYEHLHDDRLPKPEQRHTVGSHVSVESPWGADAFRETRPPGWVARSSRPR